MERAAFCPAQCAQVGTYAQGFAKIVCNGADISAFGTLDAEMYSVQFYFFDDKTVDGYFSGFQGHFLSPASLFISPFSVDLYSRMYRRILFQFAFKLLGCGQNTFFCDVGVVENLIYRSLQIIG